MSAPPKERRGKVPNAPRPEPWKPADWADEDAYAVQAVMHGRGSEDQQKRAMHFIVYILCATYDQAYRPGGDEGRRDTDFACGMQHVGKQLVKFSLLNIAALKGKNTEQGEAPKEQQ